MGANRCAAVYVSCNNTLSCHSASHTWRLVIGTISGCWSSLTSLATSTRGVSFHWTPAAAKASMKSCKKERQALPITTKTLRGPSDASASHDVHSDLRLARKLTLHPYSIAATFQVGKKLGGNCFRLHGAGTEM